MNPLPFPTNEKEAAFTEKLETLYPQESPMAKPAAKREWYGDVEVVVRARRRLSITRKGDTPPTVEEIRNALNGKRSPASVEDSMDGEDLEFLSVSNLDIDEVKE